MSCDSETGFCAFQQWEFQVGPSVGIAASDQIWVARYILEVRFRSAALQVWTHRISEWFAEIVYVWLVSENH
jgi:hypothetical protein